jgi:hypothetical protein
MKRIRSILNAIWEQIKIPTIIFTFFFFGGFGFYHGIVTGSTYTGLLTGKVLIVSLIDTKNTSQP